MRTEQCHDCDGRGYHLVSRQVDVDAWKPVYDVDGNRETVECETCRGHGELVACEEQGCKALVPVPFAKECCGKSMCEDCLAEFHYDCEASPDATPLLESVRPFEDVQIDGDRIRFAE